VSKRENLPLLPRFERAVRCLLHLQAGGSITRRWLMDHLGLSCAQAKRDLNEIERVLPVHRTNGVIRL
jgi:DeoR/GlpR family transcriptional regulator of sugar metabolism